MFKRYWAKGLGLVLLTAASMLVGGFVLAGIGSHSALAQLGTTAPAITATTATPAPSVATTPDAFRDRIVDMMKDHMGLTDQQATDWADTMTGHMQAVHGDWTGTMLDQMDEYMDQYVYGYRMMNGSVPGGSSTPRGMMNGITPGAMMGGTYSQSPNGVTRGTMMGWTTTTTDGTTVPRTSTTQGPGTMMNSVTPGAMMGNTTTPTAAGGGTTQTTTAPQTYATPGNMMGGTQVTPVTPAGTSGSMMNGATSGGMMGGSAGGTTLTR